MIGDKKSSPHNKKQQKYVFAVDIPYMYGKLTYMNDGFLWQIKR